METKKVTIEGKEVDLLRYNDKWVFPMIGEYSSGLGHPPALMLYSLEKDHFEQYTTITVNLDGRSAGCQFIDTNNNPDEVLDWLEDNKFGVFTDRIMQSGYCVYPEFNFYIGDNYWAYKNFCDNMKNHIEVQKVQQKDSPVKVQQTKQQQRKPKKQNKRKL